MKFLKPGLILLLTVLVFSSGNSQEIREIGSIDTDGRAWGVDIMGDYVFVADESNGVCVIDVSDPRRPELVATCETGDRADRIRIQGQHAYVADMDGGMRIIDISNPEEPFETEFVETDGPVQDVAVSGDFAYIGATRGGVHVADVSDPDNPELIGECNTPGAVIGTLVVGDLLYIADWEEGLCVIDVSDPQNPEVIGSEDTPGRAWQVRVLGDFAYVADGVSGLQIIDVSDPENPQLIGSIDTPDEAVGLYVIDSVVFITDQESGLRLIDVSDPARPVELAVHDTPDEAHDVVVCDGIAYVVDEDSGLHIFDVSDFVSTAEITVIPEVMEIGLVGYEMRRTAEFGVSYVSNNDDEDDLNLSLLITLGERWLSVEPDEAVIEVQDTLIFELNVFVPDGFELGEQQGCIRVVPEDHELLEIDLPVSIYVVEGFGSLSGRLTDAATNDPIPGVTVSLSGFALEEITDEDGQYSFNPLPVWTYSMEVIAEGYLPFYSDEFDVEPGQDVILDIDLLHALCRSDMDSIAVELIPDRIEEIELSIHNEGNGPLRFEVERRFPVIGDAESWDLRDSIDVAEQTGDNRLQGIEFDGENFFVTGGNNGEGLGLVHVFSHEGEHIRSFDQFINSNWGMRDLAYDGELLWGGDDDIIYGFTPEGELIHQFEGPLEINRAVAWDDERGQLWVCDVTTDLFGLDREGNLLERIDLPEELHIYGLGMFPEDSSGYTIYSFSKDGDFDTQINRINPDTGELLFVTDIETPGELKAGGMCIAGSWDPMSWVCVGILQGRLEVLDQIAIWHISTRSLWLDSDPDDGIVQPGGATAINVTINSEGYSPIVELEGELIISHDGRGEAVTIPVTMRVVREDAVRPSSETSEPPTRFTLTDPYPNPFNSTTRITYGLPFASHVSLKVFNMSGREVASLVDNYHQPGTYSIQFTADNLPSGLYFVRMEASGHLTSRKLMLIR